MTSFDPSQQLVLGLDPGRNARVLGAPGSGKTALLVESYVRSVDREGWSEADVLVLAADRAQALATALAADGTQAEVRAVETKPHTRRPAAPFTTSTLQQEASRKLRMSSRQTMRTAQTLYENGYITYMRTDSPALSTPAIDAARRQASEPLSLINI